MTGHLLHVAAAARSPIGAVDGSLAKWHPVELAARVAAVAVTRAGVSPDTVDEIVLGCAEPVGAQGANLARAAAVAAGWASTAGMVIERGQTSGAAALSVACDAIRGGDAETIVVLGVSMGSTVPPGANAVNRTYGAPWGPPPAEGCDDRRLPAHRRAELAAVAAGWSRDALDAVATSSRESWATTIRPLIAASEARPGDGEPLLRTGDIVAVDSVRDRADSIDTLPAAFDATQGLLTAATFSGPADGVVALVIQRDPAVEPLARILATSRAVGSPDDPTGAVATAAGRAIEAAGRHGAGGLDVSNVELEIPENDAATSKLVADALGVERFNTRGGTLALAGAAGAAEELRGPIDALAVSDPGQVVLSTSVGTDGSVATLWERLGGEVDAAAS